MSADLLRRAASLMRDRAEAATAGPWEVGDHWHVQGTSHCRCDLHGALAWEGVRDINGKRMQAHVHRRPEAIGGDIMQGDASNGYPANVTIGNDWGPATSGDDAEHIAGMHPGVALAMADWLDAVVADAEHRAKTINASFVETLAAHEKRGGTVDDAMRLCTEHTAEDMRIQPAAVDLARAYLGEDS